jgi:hypothetical protein
LPEGAEPPSGSKNNNDNLRFEVMVGEKTDYEDNGPDTRAVKTG